MKEDTYAFIQIQSDPKSDQSANDLWLYKTNYLYDIEELAEKIFIHNKGIDAAESFKQARLFLEEAYEHHKFIEEMEIT
jgi:hypothetical protein